MPNPPNQLQHKTRIVACANNYEDFLTLMDEMVNSVCDIRHPIGVETDHELDLRNGISTYLKKTIDNIRFTRNNLNNKSAGQTDD